VEGFIRCDPFGKGNPKRLHVVFSPGLNMIFRSDYLANVTPEGILPVFPVRCFKTPGRVIGRGYFERYEEGNDSIDGKYNSVEYRDRMSSNPIAGIHEDVLADELSDEDVVLEPGKVFKLKAEKTLKDFIEFLAMPDLNSRTVELLNQNLQMLQMRTGISSASQGELKGVPQSNTATGVNQIISRGAVLLKWPITQIKNDLEKPVEYAVHLNYANQDDDETFVWGEGKDAELINIKANDVKGLRANVSLSLTQSQNQTKLQSAQAAIGIAATYSTLPEIEKTAQRRLFVQAIKSLGFDDADKIIRDAIVNPAEILNLLPPELKPVFEQFLASQRAVPQASNGAADAPVTESAPSV
jgi:hypothetical protein